METDGNQAASRRAASVGSLAASHLLSDGLDGPAALPGAAVPEASVPDSELSAGGRTPRQIEAGIYAYCAVMGLTTVILCLTGPLHGVGPIRAVAPQAAMFAIIFVFSVLAAWLSVALHYRGDTYDFALGEVPLLIGLVFLSPDLLVLATACAVAFNFTLLRRQAPLKIAFNVASYSMAAALAAIVYREILGTHSPVSLIGWVAGVAALLTCDVALHFALRVVIKLNGGQTAERRTGIIVLALEAMLTVASICLAFVFFNAVWFDPWAALPLLLVAALLIGAYRGYSRLSLRFSSLQRLYEFSRTIGSANLEPSSMSVDVLKEVCTVMRSRRAKLILAEPSGIPRRISYDQRGVSGVEPITLSEASIATQAITTGKGSRHNVLPQEADAVDPIAGEYRNAVVAPLMNQHTPVGAIIALDRDEEADPFDEDDLRLFETLVAHASTSLERARLVEELRYEVDSKSHQATHDMLTGLPNRMLFLTRAAAALTESRGVAIVLLDIDRFKDVNDTLGHAIGDRLLCEIAERLLHAVSGRATVARLGGDEFALVVADVSDPEQALEIVNQLNIEMQRPIKMDGLTLAVTASAGIAMAPEHGDDAALLLQRADIAMYLAKERRNAVEFYSVEHDQSMQRFLMLAGLLTHALEAGSELSLMYQPIGDVRSRDIAYVEALCRWNHPVQGFIPPEEFIGIAEQMGLIPQITDFVLNEGCAQLARWRDAGITIGLAVNVSGREFADINLVDRVEECLRRYDIPAHLLTLEVTETEIMADLGAATKVLYELSARGIKLGIDDYGTGYSSLEYLQKLPVNELKIDRSFVTNLPSEESNRIIVRSSIDMAHSLGLYVIAEGAEDELTCAMLAEANCDFIQGYYLSKPQKADDLQEWILGGAKLEYAPLTRIPDSEGAALMLMTKSS